MKRIVASCDNLEAHDGALVEGAEVVVAIGSTLGALDLCELCHKALVQPLESILGDAGQPVGQPPRWRVPSPQKAAQGPAQDPAAAPKPRRGRKPGGGRAVGDTGCPVPGCNYGTAQRPAVVSHVKNHHGETMAVLEGRYGRLLNGERVAMAHRCDVCDAGYSDPGSLTMHLRLGHPKQGPRRES